VDRIRKLRQSAAYLPSDQRRCRRANAGGKEDAVVVSIAPEARVETDLPMGLDAIAREGARRMPAAALQAEVGDTWLPPAASATSWDGHSSRATGWPGNGRSRRWPERCRSRLLG
jgi:hypothetical protein